MNHEYDHTAAVAAFLFVMGLLFIAIIAGFALLLSGCSLHVGSSPCEAYVGAVERRLVECGLWDDWYRSQVQRIAAQCDGGFFGITLIDGDQADECIAKVRATSCERIERGAPTCIGAVKL